MAVRIRKNGRIFCAALRPAEEGDIYIDDDLHYQLAAEHKLLVTEPHDQHQINAEWWWRNQVPSCVEIDEYYGGIV